ncbi:hypothetical protein M885DRAFT_539872 [Pelagophyceae sp. CCMP2097]|nr:hypothetical protein M885DRAFT_539872 [Pelagophyceae sp. CCMP2097]
MGPKPPRRKLTEKRGSCLGQKASPRARTAPPGRGHGSASVAPLATRALARG